MLLITSGEWINNYSNTFSTVKSYCSIWQAYSDVDPTRHSNKKDAFSIVSLK